ncbi:MAG: L-threonylcarbamoyladenylate synthase [Desulfovibrio sp.]|nr:L-threonylcarbamoyladenylate synthase [Desulfovibrio sp.]
MMVDRDDAVRLLLDGGLLLYPTETFYALGVLASNHEGLANICSLKERPREKPLPLLASSTRQVRLFCRFGPVSERLSSLWPAPLTLVLPLKEGVAFAHCLCNVENKVALRVSANPIARFLCAETAQLLTASSANLRGRSPVTRPEDLDEGFLTKLRSLSLPIGLLCHGEGFAPLGGFPSTIVEPCEGTTDRVRLLREGAYARQLLCDKGFFCL